MTLIKKKEKQKKMKILRLRKMKKKKKEIGQSKWVRMKENEEKRIYS